MASAKFDKSLWQSMSVRRLMLSVFTAFFSLFSNAAAEEHTADSLDTVKENIEAKKAVLVDVREKREWDDGHVDQALHVPLSELKAPETARRLIARLPKNRIIYTHCVAGVRSLTAAKILRKHGVEVRPLKEGYDDLLEAGFKKAADE